MLRVSRRFYEAIKLNEQPGYKIAWKAGIHPVTLSRILHGYDRVYPNDRRVISVGKVLGLQPVECFEDKELGKGIGGEI